MGQTFDELDEKQSLFGYGILTDEGRRQLEERGAGFLLAIFLGAPAEAANDLFVLREWWDKAGSDAQTACPKEIIPQNW